MAELGSPAPADLLYPYNLLPAMSQDAIISVPLFANRLGGVPEKGGAMASLEAGQNSSQIAGPWRRHLVVASLGRVARSCRDPPCM